MKLVNLYLHIYLLSNPRLRSFCIYVQIGGFRLPFLGVGGIILLFVPLIMVLMKPTSEYMASIAYAGTSSPLTNGHTHQTSNDIVYAIVTQ